MKREERDEKDEKTRDGRGWAEGGTLAETRRRTCGKSV